MDTMDERAYCDGRLHECPVETSLELISGKWKPRLLWKLHQQPVIRFGEFRRAMPEITPKMLTQQLRELERDGLVTRRVFAEVPPHVEYSLSGFGETLQPVLEAIAAWGLTQHSAVRSIIEQQSAAAGE